ncbi:hypothetical protein FKM82_005406 [Ascaphus truei]
MGKMSTQHAKIQFSRRLGTFFMKTTSLKLAHPFDPGLACDAAGVRVLVTTTGQIRSLAQLFKTTHLQAHRYLNMVLQGAASNAL